MKKYLSMIVSLMIASQMGYSQSAVREMDIDLQMNTAASGAVAPATGAQSASTHAQDTADLSIPPMLPSAKLVLGQNDGKARVYEVKGKVNWIRKGMPVQQSLKRNDLVHAGDVIETGPNSSASIAFDDNYLNAVYISSDTRAVIESVEPTNVSLENGAVFSAVNGLPNHSSWKVTTPAAVAAVRGTLYWVRYQAANGQFYAATVNVPDDGHDSEIEIQELGGSQTADVPEGKEITLIQGQSPDQSLVQDLDPSTLQEILAFFENLLSEQESRDGGQVPPTGNDDFSGMGDQGNMTDPSDTGETNLDQIDTGVLPEEETPQPEEKVEPEQKHSLEGFGIIQIPRLPDTECHAPEGSYCL